MKIKDIEISKLPEIISNQNKGLILAGITAFLWGFLAIALRIALEYFDTYTIVWFRFTIAFVFLTSYYAISNPSGLKIMTRPPALMILAAVFLGINYIGYTQGIKYAGPAIAQVLFQFGPIILGLIGFLLYKERINLLKAIGLVIAGLGFLFFYNQEIGKNVFEVETFNSGLVWTLIASVAWVGYAIINKHLVKKHPSSQLNLILYGVPMLLILPFVNFNQFTDISIMKWILLIYLGLNTIVAYGALSEALKYADANKVSVIIALNPIITFAVLEYMAHCGKLWFEVSPMTFLGYIGAVFVFAGGLLALGLAGIRKDAKKMNH